MDHLSLTEQSKGNIKRAEIEKTIKDMFDSDLYKNGSAKSLENFKCSLQEIVKIFEEEAKLDQERKSRKSETKRLKSDKPTGMRKKSISWTKYTM